MFKIVTQMELLLHFELFSYIAELVRYTYFENFLHFMNYLAEDLPMNF